MDDDRYDEFRVAYEFSEFLAYPSEAVELEVRG